MAVAATSVRKASVPLLPRGVRLHKDAVRDTWVLLAPERTVSLDAIGYAILSKVDGTKSVDEIVDALAVDFNAPAAQIMADVTAFLQGLSDKLFLEVL